MYNSQNGTNRLANTKGEEAWRKLFRVNNNCWKKKEKKMAKWLQKRFKKLDQAEIKTRTCPNCGFERIRKDDNFCMMCGIDVRKDRRKAPTKGQ